MAEGRKTGGRRKGIPNLPTQTVIAMLKERNYDPIRHMIDLATDPETETALKVKCASEIAKYTYPQRKAVEHSGEGGGPMQIQIVDFTKAWDAEGGDGKN